MSVVVIGQDPKIRPQQATCTNCGAILSYLPEDLSIVDNIEFTGVRYGKSYINCPRCEHEIIVHSWHYKMLDE